MNFQLRNIPFYLLCFMIPFENTALASIGGVFTAPLAILLIPFFLIYIVFSINKLSGSSYFIIKYLFLFTAYSLAMLYFYSDKYDLYFLTDRGFRFLLLAIPPIAIFIIVTMQTKEVMKKGIFIIFSIVVTSFIINLVAPNIVNSPSFIQNTPALSIDRMRGFTLEASTFGFQFVLISLMFLAIAKFKPIFFFPLIVIACLLITSKGTIIVFLIAIGTTYVIFSPLHPGLKIFLSTLMGIAIFLILELFLQDAFMRDIEKYNSIATRSTVILTSLTTMISTPLGSGFFGFLPSVYENGHIAVNIMDSLFPSMLNFSEFTTYLVVGATDGISTKSFFFDWLIFGGLPFLYFYVKYISRLFKSFYIDKNRIEVSTLLFLVLSTMFFIPIEAHYIAPFALGFLYNQYKENILDENSNNT